MRIQHPHRRIWGRCPIGRWGLGPKRTLTNLYNAHPTWLELAHRKLDEAVFAAYGWPSDLSDEEILERLLALNLSDKKQLNLMLENRIVKKTLYILEMVFIVELTQLMLLEGPGSYTENFPPTASCINI